MYADGSDRFQLTSLCLSHAHAHTTPPHAESERANGGDMAHSPSGSHAAAPSIGDEAFTDAVAEDGGDSKLSALLFGTTTSPRGSLPQSPSPLLLSTRDAESVCYWVRSDYSPHRLVVADAEFPNSCFLRGMFGAGVRGSNPPWCLVAWFRSTARVCGLLRIASNLVHIHPILLGSVVSPSRPDSIHCLGLCSLGNI